jgi:uncharacterized protein
MKIGIDMDGVVVDLLAIWCDKYNKDPRVSVEIFPCDITEWSPHKVMKEISKREIYDILNEGDTFKKAPRIEGAIEGVEDLLLDGHEVYFITACVGPTAFSEKLWWVKKHIPIMKDNLIGVAKGTTKGKLFGEFFDIMLDDKVSYIKDATRSRRILFSAPHNMSFDKGYDDRVDSWDEFLDII